MSSSKTKTILIADDDEGHLLLTEAALAGAGFVVVTAHDGAQAVTEFATSHPDLVILDVMMPNMTGIEACGADSTAAGWPAPPDIDADRAK